MSESNNNPLFGRPVRAIDEAGQLLGRMFDIARTDAVFGAPLTQDGATVIVASELTVGMGVGFGSGEGSEGEGSGGGGGGGGYALGRPVAVVSIDAQGVRVQPIFDLTKVAIAAITALGAMAIAYRQMARVADKA
ncbi:MAG: hypothetical protein IAE81_03995 [Caldilineaceae bacterium]|jgi:uncharacterized spore protein YtfJ|nr:hypothetical protein [Caldilineaceae bacterium]